MEAYAKQAKELQDLKRKLTACKDDAMESRGELEAKVAFLTAKLEATQIDLVMIMIGTRDGYFRFSDQHHTTYRLVYLKRPAPRCRTYRRNALFPKFFQNGRV